MLHPQIQRKRRQSLQITYMSNFLLLSTCVFMFGPKHMHVKSFALHSSPDRNHPIVSFTKPSTPFQRKSNIINFIVPSPFIESKATTCLHSTSTNDFENNDDDDYTISSSALPDSLPKVSIEYCTGCRWMLRAAWLAQELLTTFQDDLHSVSLVPSRPPSPGGSFIVTITKEKVNNSSPEIIEIWNRKSEKRFPEAKELKQRIRDIILPDRDLGHSDVTPKISTTMNNVDNRSETISLTKEEEQKEEEQKEESECEDCENDANIGKNDYKFDDFLDDDEASDMRDYFGVA